MLDNRIQIIELEIARIIEISKQGKYDWLKVLKEMLTNIAKYYRISKASIKTELPATMFRSKAVNISQVFYDYGLHSEQSDVIVDTRMAGGGGVSTVTLVAEDGVLWDAIDHKDLNLLLHVSFVHASLMMATQYLDKTMVTDFATGLYNQQGFFAHIERCISRDEASDYFIVFFNVHNFKYVNKVFSYHEGDKVLTKYGQAIGKLVEGDECIGRMGGDNFVAYIHKEHLRRFVEQIDHIVVEHEADNTFKRFEFSAAKGIAAMGEKPDSRVAMGHCSLAYQYARRSHRDTVFFSEELYASMMKKQDIVLRFQDAIEKEEFVVYYQPKVNTEKLELCGAEALVRWMRDGELHMPMEFVPVFEENGYICTLDYYVLDDVCKRLESWKREGKDLIRVSVNFSRRHLEESGFVSAIKNIISKYDIDPKYIEVELTESDNFQDYSIMSKVVADLKKIGVSTSIDDFGTGYSSLNMLKSTEFDIVKIDRSFIPQETDSDTQKRKNMAMFQSIMELIGVLGMESIAEGVETRAQLDYFAESKCRMVQGYIFDRPLPCEEFEKRLNKRKYTLNN